MFVPRIVIPGVLFADKVVLFKVFSKVSFPVECCKKFVQKNPACHTYGPRYLGGIIVCVSGQMCNRYIDIDTLTLSRRIIVQDVNICSRLFFLL